MKKYFNFLIIFILPFMFSGCLTAKEQDYKFNYENGAFEIDYHDVRSQKDQDPKKDAVAEDWASVKQALVKKDDFDPNVVAVKSKKIFKEGDVLSGTAIYQVQCPKCFPSRLDILQLLYDDGHWEEYDNEIFLILPNDRHITATNGTMLKTPKNIIGVWPSDSKNFEFSISNDNSKDISLLNKYLKTGTQ